MMSSDDTFLLEIMDGIFLYSLLAPKILKASYFLGKTKQTNQTNKKQPTTIAIHWVITMPQTPFWTLYES